MFPFPLAPLPATGGMLSRLDLKPKGLGKSIALPLMTLDNDSTYKGVMINCPTSFLPGVRVCVCVCVCTRVCVLYED